MKIDGTTLNIPPSEYGYTKIKGYVNSSYEFTSNHRKRGSSNCEPIGAANKRH